MSHYLSTARELSPRTATQRDTSLYVREIHRSGPKDGFARLFESRKGGNRLAKVFMPECKSSVHLPSPSPLSLPLLPSTPLPLSHISFHLTLHVSYCFTHSSSFAVSVILAAALLTLLTTSSAVSCTPLPNSASLALALSTAAMSLPCALSRAPFSGP